MAESNKGSIMANLPIEEIHNLYVKERKTLTWLGKQFDCYAETIKRALIKHDPSIKIRSLSDTQRPALLNDPHFVKEIDSIYNTARKLNVRADVVITACRRYNLANPHNMMLPNDVDNLLRRKKTWDGKKFIDKLGVSKKFAIDFLKNRGFPIDMFNPPKRKKKGQKSDWERISCTGLCVDNPVDPAKLTDRDIFFYLDWGLIFNNATECYEWLKSHRFYDIEHPTWRLEHGIKRYKAISREIKSESKINIVDGFKWLNANICVQSVVALLKHFSPHFWHSSHNEYQPPSVCWEIGNYTVLKKACIKMWSGRTKRGHPKKRNIYRLLSTISTFYKDFNTVSIFKPWIASSIYQKLIPNGGIVIDPCMGWGGRLLGCIDHDIKYYGYDLNPLAVESNQKLAEYISDHIYKPHFSVADATNFKYPEGDLLLTSPPYDNTEHYYGLKEQCIDTKPIYHNLFETDIKLIALNVPKRHEELCIQIAKEHNWRCVDNIKMKTKNFQGERETTYEPILIFRKSNG